MSVRKKLATTAVLWAFCAQSAFAELGLNMTRGVTDVSEMVYTLHMQALIMVSVIGAGVFGVMIYSIFTHRKSKGAVPAKFHHSTSLELVWTIIPIFILVAFAYPATQALIVMEETLEPDITIKITGYQWRWHYEYLDDEFGFFSTLARESQDARTLKSGADVSSIDNYLLDVDNPVVIPVNKKIRFLTTSNDVIHSWWVPDLGWKRDAIPGFINDDWTVVNEPGTYRGQCAELCGKDHAYMPVVLRAVPEDEYLEWVSEMQRIQADAASGVDREWTMEELMQRGQAMYTSTCVACHQANGQGLPPAFPALSGSPITTGPIEDHIEIVLNGKVGTTMQAFGQQFNPIDLAAVITFERNALGNSVGDMVQPAAIRDLQADATGVEE
jgi:cytochrome c oxidase subunit 2